MTQDMNHTFVKALRAVLVVVLMSLSGNNALAQVKVNGDVYGGGNLAPVNGSCTVVINVNPPTDGNKNVAGDVYGGGALANTNTSEYIVKTGLTVGTSDVTGLYERTGAGTDASPYSYTATEDATAQNEKTYYEKTSTSVTLTKGQVNGSVYGGGLGRQASTGVTAVEANVGGAVTVNVTGGTATNVFGCNNLNGSPQSTVEVNISGGEVTLDVYGGGNLANTTVSPVVNISGGTVTRDVYGGGALANTGGSTVNVTSGTVTRDVYGGGLGDGDYAALENGTVTVNIGAMQPGANEGDNPTYSGEATIGGSVFGCNNANGSPQGDVFVNIYQTKHIAANTYPTDVDDLTKLATEVEDNEAATYSSKFAISAVYGGGNKAAYNPAVKSEGFYKTQVHVYQCTSNTIQAVYGGGNAANATNVSVIIDGGFFDQIFGGGNGAGNHDDTSAADYNPGANITGSAITQIHGGLYRQVFGGSNSKGDVASASLTLDTESDCSPSVLLVHESFGGANEADITGSVSTTLACSGNKIGSFYGGSNLANITGNVTLNVYGGTYTNVFGGSKGRAANTDQNISAKAANITGAVTLNLYGGTISNAFGGSDVNGNITGKITVNVLDYQSASCPLTVTNIYGAGNLTAYTPNQVSSQVISSPEINVMHIKSGNSISGNVYGGGKGDADHDARVTANPVVNIGYDATTMSSLIPTGYIGDAGVLTSPDDLIAKVGGNVYGGGDLAQVTGNTTVYLRKANSSVGGSLFGGGNEANVSGNTAVNIVDGTVTQDVYGGGALANVGTNAENATQVTITGGTVRNVYGGGLGRAEVTAVADDLSTPDVDETVAGVEGIAAAVNGAVTVTINGGTVTDVFGCNNYNGSPTSTVAVNINKTSNTWSVGRVFGGGNLATATCSPIVNITEGTVSQVFGGGNEAGVGGSTVNVNGGAITAGLYGGCNTSGTVNGDIVLSLTDGFVGVDGTTTDAVYGGGYGSGTSTTGDITIALSGTGTTVYGNLYGGSALGSVNAANKITTLTIGTNTIHGTIFGGGKGSNDGAGTTATSNGNVLINYNTENTSLEGLYGGANINGNVAGNISVNINANVGASGNNINIYGGGLGSATTTDGNVTVTIDKPTGENTTAPTIYGDIYGGSSLGEVGASGMTAKVDFIDGILHGVIYGGGMGDDSNAATVSGGTQVAVSGGTINGKLIDTEGTGSNAVNTYGAVFGGCNANGTVMGDVTIGITSGTIGASAQHTNVYGGGLGEKTNVMGAVGITLSGTTTNSVNSTNIYGDVYGGSAKGRVNCTIGGTSSDPTYALTTDKTTTVTLSGAVVNGDIYGGGHGLKSMPADVWGPVTVTINSGTISGSVYGCNNAAGTPKNDVEVDIYGTDHGADIAHDLYPSTTPTGGWNATTLAANSTTQAYAISAVYGGGNRAAYIPVAVTSGDPHSATVHVYNCDNTIQYVYGGGNAADVGSTGTDAITANTFVIIDGGRINRVFGGGNGAGTGNPGANIYGTASTILYAGLIDQVFGGSNERGNVATANLVIGHDDNNTCDMFYGEVFGGGNLGEVRGNLITTIECGAGDFGDFYGGANAADIYGNVTLNIYGGTFTNVFGGSKGISSGTAANIKDNTETTAKEGNVTLNLYGGTIENAFGGSNYNGNIEGVITVNMLDLGGSCALNVNNIYGASNLTAYTPNNTTSGVKPVSPVVNIIHGTISKKADNTGGNVFGGAYGADATVTANPIVRIGYDESTMSSYLPTSVQLPATYSTTIEGNVYGGGDLAQVTGGTTVSINGGTVNNDVYGGGNQATVTGSVSVTINGGTVSQDVYGGGALAETNTTAVSGVYPATTVALQSGSVRNLYGGGLGQKTGVNGATSDIAADVHGNVTVTVSGGTAAKVFGANNVNGAPQGTVTVNINNTATAGIGNVYGGGNAAAYTGSPTVTLTGGTITTNVYGGGLGSTATVIGDPQVRLQGATVTGKVYGGGSAAPVTGSSIVSTSNASSSAAAIFGGGEGATAEVTGNPSVTIGGGTIANVYGGGDLALVTGNTTVTTTGGTVSNNLFGGGNNANVTGSTTVTINGGEVTDVYGGGALAHTNTANWDATKNSNEGGWADGQTTTTNDKTTTVEKTIVSLTGGTITGNVYGGGLGNSTTAAYVYGDVTVTLNGAKSEGSIFGCNNVKGTPKGHVKVHVVKTGSERVGTTPIANRTAPYDLLAVYGGGNQADYRPVNNSDYAEVLIEGCEETSIQNVYGGGNAAAVPATEVTVMGAYIINNLYGGGNGAGYMDAGNTIPNPGADVGYYDHSKTNTYGTGKALTKLLGGYINNVYGGSNTKGDIRGGTDLKTKKEGIASLTPSGDCCNKLVVDNLYGAGSMADVDGDVDITLDCMPDDYVAEVYGGAENASINGSVTLTVTSGKFGRVFGGNNAGGNIKGSITVNINEGGCKPLEIGEVFGGGNAAPYSIYGCEKVGDAWVANTTSTKIDGSSNLPSGKQYGVEVNVYACTSIGKVFGGGYGESAKVIGDTHVWVNMMKGYVNDVEQSTIGRIGQIYGGGSAAEVIGNTTVDIGTITVSEDAGAIITNGNYINPDATEYKSDATKHYIPIEGGVYGGGMNAAVDGNTTVNIGTAAQSLGVNIAGNIYGGGKEGDVTGNTQVNVCAVQSGSSYTSITPSPAGVTITGNVYGGGKGVADSFTCAKAMVGINDAGLTDTSDGGTTIVIGNGTINGNVYGGGEIGRVEKNTKVTIGLGEGSETVSSTSSVPVVTGNVFGGGKGKETHGYAALVRGNPTVIVQGNAKVRKSVYGGGEIASVARYNVPKNEAEVEAAIAKGYEAVLGMPYALKDANSGFCTVTVQGYAEIGPDDMKMYHSEITDGSDKPDDTGYVFGAGKGILPENYTYADNDHRPKRMVLYDEKKYNSTNAAYWSYVSETDHQNVWEYFPDIDSYIKFIQTLALSSQTTVTVGKNAFVKGSVYGGSENGIVQFDTRVTIKDNCQIGNGEGVNRRYTEADWASESLAECAHWDYGMDTNKDGKKDLFAPYDPYANATGNLGQYSNGKSTEGGRRFATDGHTYYGNVFGGGSGSVPYFDNKEGISKYLNSAGLVKGNTTVNINGGHILTNVYGGCETTNVLGTANVTMTGGTVGVPRTDDQIIAHPVTGYLFGAGKGDQRIFFNKDTNVEGAVVSVTGGRIYGSVYGGGEDGHVLGNVNLSVNSTNTAEPTKIGTKGTSYYDGHVFGGGRGFGGEALTAGNVSGSVTMTIDGGDILGSVYGGGRMASVGYGLYLVDEEITVDGQTVKPYGTMRPDNMDDKGNTVSNFKRGYIDITINGGTIGNNDEYVYSSASKVTHTKGGNVFAGSMGSLYQQDGTTTNSQWMLFAHAKQTKLTINDGIIKSCVYGGGELGAITENTEIIIKDGTIGTEIGTGDNRYYFGSVFGGGYGSTVETLTVGSNTESNPKLDAGLVHGSTKITMENGAVMASVYGGGEVASVKGSTDLAISGGTIGVSGFGGIEIGNVYGGGKGDKNIVRAGHIFGNTKVTISEADASKPTQIWHNIYGGGAYGTVGDFDYLTEYNEAFGTDKVIKVKGLKEGTTGGTAEVYISGGTIGRNGKENGMVFGSSRGDVGAPESRDDLLAWTNDTKVEISGSAKIRGSVYGGGENGHNFNDAVVNIKGGTIGIAEGEAIDSYSGAAYPYRGNVYGGGCGTDKYYSSTVPTGHTATDGQGDKYNPLAGIIQGNATVTISGGTVVRNVYGAGAMGSVGIISADGTISGGLTTIEIKGGTIGVSGTVGDGNVYGAARGDANATSNEFALVRKETNVSITDGTVKGNVYGGGELGCVGTYVFTNDMKNFMWTNDANPDPNSYTYNNTGVCNVTISGGTIGTGVAMNADGTYANGNVFGAGKGLEDTWWCEKAIVYKANVTVSDGTINGTVYGGGQVGRVENNTLVTIGTENESGGTSKPNITGNVFGAGAGLMTHGYSALVRGNASVTVQGTSLVGGSVYGGGEIASVGRFTLVGGLPKHPDSGGICTVNILDHAKIGSSGTGHNVFGACKGVTPAYVASGENRSKSMQLLANAPEETSLWSHYNNDVNSPFIWRYYPDEAAYLEFLETLALTSHPIVTIAEDATVNGSVFGGGERGITLGSVEVNMNGGTVTQDVYGGGALANTNKGNWETTTNTWAENKTSATYTTKVNLLGGTINGDAYGGGLGRKEYGTKGQAGYVSPIEAMVYGDVLVELNKIQDEDGNMKTSATGCVVNRVFGCNNLNGTPKGKVQVYVYATQKKNGSNLLDKTKGSYDVDAVYGGGNLAPYIPADATLDYATNKAKVDAARTEVIIDGCALTSIKQVYGGGNAAPVPATYVEIRRAYEIDEVFGGGNGYDNYSLEEGNATVWYQNPGANVGYYTYATYPKGTGQGSGSQADPYIAVETSKFAGGAENKPNRLSTSDQDAVALRYGSGVAKLEVKGGLIHTSYGGSNSKGNVRALLASSYSAMFDDCEMIVDQSYGGGKNAYSDAESEVIADCAKGVKEMFGGAKDADFDGNINMLISNGSSLERVFGGNNTSGAVNGSITITIKEGGCEPIRIGSLYAGGFLAPYSVYGYEKNADGTYKTELVDYLDENNVKKQKLQRIPLKKGDPGALATPHADPRINVISATRIDSIFGGGYQAKLVGNPHINVNMEPGRILANYVEDTETNPFVGEHKDDQGHVLYVGDHIVTEEGDEKGDGILAIGTIGSIFGGGNMADIVGDTYVEIGTGTWYNADGVLETEDANGKTWTYNETTKKWTCGDMTSEDAPVPVRNAATITGNVFGGGKGIADSFQCAKAMIGEVDKGYGNTNITIGNGTVGGSVYGGGEIGRVEANTNVMIGLESGTGKPTIEGDVFGAGKGLSTHGYSALVRGNTTVIIQGDAKVGHNVYGGGEIASVGKYNIADEAYHAAHPEVEVGMPYSLVSDERGICNVIVRGNAEIGPDNMKMLNTVTGKPDDTGHVFGAGKGVLPYEGYEPNVKAWRMPPSNIKEEYLSLSEAINGKDETDYLRFIETLGLATQTKVTIGGNAFVKGSVYGGSENGHVQHDTYVTIQDDCQIGNGNGVNRRYTADEWTYDGSTEAKSLAECASWDYVPTDAAPYDPYAKYSKTVGGKVTYYYDEACTKTAEGGYYIGKDGHTFYGNVFGGGSGLIPYAPGMWHRAAGSVGGNTQVDITGGHILTSVYGGNEQTDVGAYAPDKNNNNALTIPVAGTGKCTVNMSGGTLGVPRTVEQMKAHPLTCYLFGAGKGDQRIFFNTWTNVIETEVNISGNARIYGSTFGGGEDGHVIENAVTNIGKSGADNSKIIIGTTGTSYVDGNVFGGGRGFSGDAQTAGTVGGNVTVNIEGGTMLGSIYGGGRLASVGTLFTAPDHPNYGNFQEDTDAKTYGHVTVNISGGTIGNTVGNKESGNVFGGSMGRLDLLNGTRNPIWPRMAQVKTAAVNIYGDAEIKRSVYGGGELGTIRDNACVTIGGYLTVSGNDSTITASGAPTIYRDVYGGGYGSEDQKYTVFSVKEPKPGVTNPSSSSDYNDNTYAFTPMQFAGCVGQNTFVHIKGGWVKKSVYGGGELASVGIINCMAKEKTSELSADKVVIQDERTGKDYYYTNMVKHADIREEDGKQVYYGFALSWPYEFKYVDGFDGATHVNITGGRIGLKNGDTNYFEDDDYGDVCGGGKGKAGDYKNYVFCANVGSTEVNINIDNGVTPENVGTGDCISGAVYGGAENGHVMRDTYLKFEKGLIGHSIYGGGSGKGKFSTSLLKIGSTSEHSTRDIYSITAGKVFGNSTVEMTGGTVVRNVYGGGNMGSVGKGNYSGGSDDYSAAGYGELPPKDNQKLWTTAYNSADENSTKDYPWHFLNSGKCIVNITGGTVGYINDSDLKNSIYPKDPNTGLPYGNVFGGCRGASAPNIGESPRYLYCPEFFLGYANETSVTIGTVGQSSEGAGQSGKAPLIIGSVYGGGQDGHVRRDASVTINSGEIGSTYNNTKYKNDFNYDFWLNMGNVYGAGSGIGKYEYDFNYDGDFDDEIDYTNPQTKKTSKMKERDFSTSAGSVTRFTEVIINGGNIHRNVYGGGSLSSVGGPKIPPISTDPVRRDNSATDTKGMQSLNQVTITGGQIGDNSSFDEAGNHIYGGYVFGASRGDENLSNPASYAQAVWTGVDVKGGTIAGDVYGGGEVGSVRQGTEVQLTGGTIAHDAYGGGRGTTNVAANVGGKTLVKLNEGVGEDEKGCVVSRIFGGNNVNGTPGGKTQVYVYATQNKDKADIKTKNAKHEGIEEGTTTTYDLLAVYGGGNLSPYVPAGEADQTEVYIQGCDLTSIKQVYGGGNSASTPATMVTVNSTYEIQDLFGGGDGQGSESGANVGYKAYDPAFDPPASSKEVRTSKFAYGSGVAALNIYGGRIHRVFGGSNTKGNVRETAITMLDNQDPCPLDIDEVYGGGKSAPMDAEAILHMACIPGLKVAYGGAQEADVLNNVVLNITNGTYDRVFGGNNISGTINGSITVNIEETGCTPVIIGELYGGGNLAGYSVYGYNEDRSLKQSGTRLYADPQINVKSFTSIGNIYGGGLGESAVMVGNPTVNINEVKGDYADYVGNPTEYDDNYDYDATGYKGTVKKIDGRDVTIPSHEKGKIGAIQNVFGGGNAAKVIGDTNVNIGTESTVTFETKTKEVTVKDEQGNIVYEDEAHTKPKVETVKVTDPVTVIGADIRGNVYGGGNAAVVTGKTNVVIGEKKN